MVKDQRRESAGKFDETAPKDNQTGSTDPDVVEPEHALPPVTMGSLPEDLRKAAARAKWTALMPVQAKAIPYVLAKRDLMVQSRTGSGKTGAYLLPALKRIDPKRPACQVLVLVPTRELAKQVAHEAETMGEAMGVRTVAVYGGTSYQPQFEAFRKGAHLVVGTPGRVLDHLLRGSLLLKSLRILVLDEADRMLSMGFYPDMKEVQSYLPGHSVNGYMFSATFPPHVMRLADQFLHEAEFLSLSRDHVHVTEVEHVYYVVPPMEKDRALVRIIEIENPTSALIFCNTKAKVHYVAVVLQRFGYDADEMSSDLSQSARERVMKRIRKGVLRFLVATDVAARGIDLPDLSHAIIYEPSEDPEIYIHRAGRTGRAGGSGEAISLVSVMEGLDLKRVATRYGIDMLERPLPTDEDVQAIVSERVMARLEARLRKRDRLKVERMQRFVPLARQLAEEGDELDLVAMLMDDFYDGTLNAPVAPPSVVETRKRDSRPQSRSRKKRPRRRDGRRGR